MEIMESQGKLFCMLQFAKAGKHIFEEKWMNNILLDVNFMGGTQSASKKDACYVNAKVFVNGVGQMKIWRVFVFLYYSSTIYIYYLLKFQ